MTKENLLFSICGFLLGAIVGTLFLGPQFHQLQLERGTPRATQAAAASGAAPQPQGDPAVTAMVAQQMSSLQRKLQQDPNDFDAAVQLGNLYMDAGKYEEAIEHYRRALKLRYDATVTTDLGICYRAIGDLDRAIETFHTVQQRDPDHWQSIFNEAVVLVDLRRIDDAKEKVKKLKQLRPGDPEIARFDQLLGGIK